MPDAHRFTAIVAPTDGQQDADDHLARYGRLHPRHHRMQLGDDWSVRNVTLGETVAEGHTDDEEDAEEQAARALERAQDRDAARLAAEQGLEWLVPRPRRR